MSHKIDRVSKLKSLAESVKRRLKTAPGCHDWEHTERVLRNVKIIMAEMSADGKKDFDPLVVECAAILHDVARPDELKANGAVCHARLGAELAPELLRECGFDDPALAARIADCVRTHRYRGDETDKPRSMAQKILFDADKLDSIGAVGVARALHFSGRIGSSIHNSENEALASNAYGEGDSAYREYLVKLRHIPSRMLTSAGAALAAERAAFTDEFFERLNSECDSPLPVES